MITDAISRLTDKQIDCLRLVHRDCSSKDIGRQLGISHHTVDQRLKAAIAALGVGSRFEAAQLLAAHEGREAHQRLAYQAPQIARTVDPAFIGSPVSHGDAWRSGERQPMAREVPAAFALDIPLPASPHPAAAPPWRRRRNDWGLGQRLLFLAATPIMVLLFAIGLAGAGGSILRTISRLF